MLGRICKQLGWADVTAHTLRHTFGSVAGDLGYSELTIAAMLGHAEGSATSRYVHLDEAVQNAVERVSSEIASLLDEGQPREKCIRLLDRRRLRTSALDFAGGHREFP